jgi:hypothetical protein
LQIGGGQRCAFDAESGESRARIGNAMQVPRVFSREESANGGNARVLRLDRVAVNDWSQLSDALGSQRRCGALGDEGESAGEFKDAKCVSVHLLLVHPQPTAAMPKARPFSGNYKTQNYLL